MRRQYIYTLTQDSLPISVGSKAINLRSLFDMGFKIPVTYCCSWDAYNGFLEHSELVLQQLREEITEIIDLEKPYAIRSSTDLEDSQQYTYAGQFSTILDVKGLNSILQSILDVWESSKLEGLQSYQAWVGSEKPLPKMAVIVQEMVSPLLSGVAFSRNPITGLDETIIEAVEGPGMALVQEGVTPYRWVYKWGRWHEQPTDKEVYTDLIRKVVDQTKQIVKLYGKDLDLEWVYDGEEIYWVQLREITALEHVRIYSNKISKEFLPGIIKPLVWSVNIPLVNGAWIDLLTEVIGENDIKPESLARSFYYRAYFDTSTFGKIFDRLGMPRQALEINMGIVEPPEDRPTFKLTRKMVLLVPRTLRFLYDKWVFSNKIEQHFSEIESQFQDFAQVSINSISQDKLLEEIDQLYTVAQDAAYYNIVVPLLMYAYNGVMRNQLKKFGVDFEQFDLTSGLTAMDAYAPDAHLEQLSLEFGLLDPEIQETIRKCDFESFQQIPKIEGFQAQVNQFITQFGHLSDSGNDFSTCPWREDPDLILSLITTSQFSGRKKAQKVSVDDLPARGLRRWLIGVFYQRARRFRYYRERVSSVYTHGYGLFRNYYLALGDHFVYAGILAGREDIFYLYDEEIRQIVAGDILEEDIEEKVSLRKSEMQTYQDIELPEIIYGDQPPPIVSILVEKMKGTPTSRGVYTGPVRVVYGLQDFNKVNDGDVIVIPYSDVGWTPLFSKAGAIIAESGGILSHSSIIAREYNIPAVVSVANACNLEDGTIVIVDGYLGDIFIHKSNSD